MQTPERLALIGGGILLSTTLVFTLKSQASQILPKVSNGMASLVKNGSIGSFTDDLQQAQKKGWTTGQWGSSPYYIDDQGSLHIGAGQFQGALKDILGNQASNIKSINFDADVQAPSDSSNLFAGLSNLQSMNHEDRLDTSQVTNMYQMFANDGNLSALDLSNWNTDQVVTMANMFDSDASLTDLNIQSFNTMNSNVSGMFGKSYYAPLDKITFGDKTQLNKNSNLDPQIRHHSGSSFYDKDSYKNAAQLTNKVDSSGEWVTYGLTDGGDINASTSDNLQNILEKKFGLTNEPNRVYILNDQGSQVDGHLKAGDYTGDNFIAYLIFDSNGNPSLHGSYTTVK